MRRTGNTNPAFTTRGRGGAALHSIGYAYTVQGPLDSAARRDGSPCTVPKENIYTVSGAARKPKCPRLPAHYRPCSHPNLPVVKKGKRHTECTKRGAGCYAAWGLVDVMLPVQHFTMDWALAGIFADITNMSAFNVALGCIMALLLILFSISSIARYYIKFTLFTTFCLLFATAPMPLMLLRPFSPKNALIPSALLRLSARMLGIRWKVRGMENVDNSRGCVILLNHQSSLDLYVLAVLWPLMARCTVVSKRSLQYLVPFGTATWLWGTVFIDRGAQSAREALNKQATAVKAHKRKLLLFPEGTRHSGDKLLPFRKGAFHVAMDAGAPIQPVVVSKYHFLDAESHRFGSGEIIITILPMIETERISKEDIESLMQKTQIKMQEEFTRSSAETLPRRELRNKAD